MAGGVRTAALAAAAAVCFSVTAGAAALPAWAKERISEVRIRIKDQYGDGILKEPQVQVLGEESEAESVRWDKDVSEWVPGEAQTARIRLKAADGFTFEAGAAGEQDDAQPGGKNGAGGAAQDSARSGAQDGMQDSAEGEKKDSVRGAREGAGKEASGGVTVSVTGADYVSAAADGDVLEVEAAYTPVLRLGMAGRAGWDGERPGTAVWDPVPGASSYQLKLYRGQEGQETYVNMMTLTGTAADLSSYMEEEGSYYYTVKAQAPGGSQAFVSGGEKESERFNRLRENREGWRLANGKYQYTAADGTAAAGGWRYIDGGWYFFSADGYALTGWQEIGGHWYYLDDRGRMKTGWLNENGAWYYLDPTGAMATGWLELGPGNAYYFAEDGKMAYDTVVDGRKLEPSGRAE